MGINQILIAEKMFKGIVGSTLEIVNDQNLFFTQF